MVGIPEEDAVADDGLRRDLQAAPSDASASAHLGWKVDWTAPATTCSGPEVSSSSLQLRTATLSHSLKCGCRTHVQTKAGTGENVASGKEAAVSNLHKLQRLGGGVTQDMGLLHLSSRWSDCSPVSHSLPAPFQAP